MLVRHPDAVILSGPTPPSPAHRSGSSPSRTGEIATPFVRSNSQATCFVLKIDAGVPPRRRAAGRHDAPVQYATRQDSRTLPQNTIRHLRAPFDHRPRPRRRNPSSRASAATCAVDPSVPPALSIPRKSGVAAPHAPPGTSPACPGPTSLPHPAPPRPVSPPP